MDLGFTEMQDLLKNSAREFLEAECPEQLVRDMEEDDAGYSPELWSKMAEQGWQGLLIPEEYGGVGFDFLDFCVLHRGVRARAGARVRSCRAVLGGAVPLLEAGSEEQKAGVPAEHRLRRPDLHPRPDRALRPLRRAGHRRPRRPSTATRSRSAGTKLFVPDANVADYMVVAARSGNGRDAGHRGDGPAGRDGQPAADDRARQAVRGDPRRREGAAAGRRRRRLGVAAAR